MEQKPTVPVKMDKKAYGILKDLAARRGMAIGEVAGRMLQWFVAQDEMVQSYVLGQIPEQYADEMWQLIMKHRKGVDQKQQAS